MKKPLLILLTIFLSSMSYAQIMYEKGYFVNNKGEKTDCLIKNLDWKSNPVNFEYKLNEDGPSVQAEISKVKEFGIGSSSKYSRQLINIDRSSDKMDKLTFDKNPVFKEELLFLKVLLEGDATLYSYADGNLNRYFYKMNQAEVTQLIYKKFRISDNRNGENNRYKQQLLKDLKCSEIGLTDMEGLKYQKNSLVNIFAKFNRCSGSNNTVYGLTKKRDLFNLSIRPRLNNSSVAIEHSNLPERSTEISNELSFGLGVEFEFILPFNKNKWAVTVEPTYQSFKGENIIDVSSVAGGKLKTIVDYSTTEIPFGIRHYFFLNDNAKLFVNVNYILDLSTKSSTIAFKRGDNTNLSTLEVITGDNIGFGFGYKGFDRISLEMRVQTSRELGNDNFQSADYKSFSLIFGYSFF